MQLPSTHSNQVGDFPIAYPSTATSFGTLSICLFVKENAQEARLLYRKYDHLYSFGETTLCNVLKELKSKERN